MIHLDSAAAGRSSAETLRATAEHARLEAEVGSYVAQARAAPTLERLRADLGGLLGHPAEALAFTQSASDGLVALLDAWRLPPGSTVGVVAAEWGPNLEAFTRRGLDAVPLPADADGALDLAGLGSLLATTPPAGVHLTQVTSHRSLVQPVAEALALCRSAGVPLWVDVAQAVGHVDTALGADAVYGTSRKWLRGPRGVGFLAVAPSFWDRLDVPRPALLPADLPLPRYLEAFEAHIAGRVGLAAAVGEYLSAGPAAVASRLAEVGGLTRSALADLPGWRAVGPVAGAITALEPLAGQDVFAVREGLVAGHGIVTTGCSPARAPLEPARSLLRISPHVDCTKADLDRLVTAIRTFS